MARRSHLTFFLSCLVVLGLHSAGRSAGLANSAWPMFRHDASHRGVSPAHDPTPATTYWKYSVGSDYSSPVIGADGTVYVSGSTNFYALTSNGTLKWKWAIGKSTRSTPAIADDGTIYIGSSDFKLYAINPNGTVKWSFLTGNQVSSSPAIGTDGTVYVGSTDGKLYAVNPDGTQKWAITLGTQIHTSSPAIGPDGTIYVGSYDYNLYAINPDGTEKWRYKTGKEVLTSPAFSPDGATIYFGSWDGNLYALNSTGTLAWSFQLHQVSGNTQSSPAVSPDGTIYIGSSTGILHAISPSGSEIWRFETGSDIRTSPAISADGTIYFGCWNGLLYALNSDGTEKWHFMSKTGFYASPTIAADGTVVAGSTDGSIHGGLRGTPASTTPPTDLHAVVLSETQSGLTWQDRSSDEYGFRIERRLVPIGTYAQVATVGANVITYADSTAGTGLTYNYRVCAYQQGGYTAYSNEATVTMPGLAAPLDLTATAVSGTQVDLSWIDLNAGELGYRIERMSGPNGHFRQICIVAANSTSFSDTSANPATTYYYRVSAFDSTKASPYSNSAWALTDGMDFTEINRGNTVRKQMALTFDCGITPILPELLQTLRDKGVYATFFITGNVANQIPSSVAQVALDGHVVANHTLSHPMLPTITDEEVVRQLQVADDIIYGICGHHTRPWFRPPSGQRDARSLAAAQRAGFRSVYWTNGGGDFGVNGWTTQQIIDNALTNARNGGVVLFHASVPNTAAAIPTIIDTLRARGYELVTLPEIVAPEVITSPPGALCAGWNIISIPCDMANPNPRVVFRGIPIDYRLFRWDSETASQVVYDSSLPEEFGPISPDEGYCLMLDQDATIQVAGRQPANDRHIYLPQAMDGGMSIVGSPFNTPREWPNCTISHRTAGSASSASLYRATTMGWLSRTIFWWDAATQSQYDAGAPEYGPYTTQMIPWHGYEMHSFVSGLQLVIPKP